MRKARTENETRDELKRTQRTATYGAYGNFRDSRDCFRDYVKMQARFALADGFTGMAAAMESAARHAVSEALA